MSVFKCKMCGGTISFNPGDTVGVCEYCGSKQTLPRLDCEAKANLYDRANHFRRNNEFDKAMNIYEQILNEDKTDAEAYWSLVLCKYGVEYVEDPSTHKRVPTVNRAQYTSIYDDDNYKSAIKYADVSQKNIYEEEANTINQIQKGILDISNKEEPFDIFICYKETDSQGRRTLDSVLATELYHELIREGFKVFFSRITLEDKLGTAYEPYIFAALNSSKVMVVLGTKPEYFNAVWVKNEWSRFLSLIKTGERKMLIPAYKDMDPYDLPEEFSHLQAQNMSRLGFMQDLVHAIKKIVNFDAQKSTTVNENIVINESTNVTPLLKRGFLFLEDGDWNSANEYFERVLDIDPENASAYLGKLLSKLKVTKQEKLKDLAEPFNKENDYLKAIRFGDEKLKDDLDSYIKYINIRNKNARLEDVYVRAKITLSIADSEETFKESARLFESINEYKDSGVLVKECYEKAEMARKDTILSQGKQKMSSHIVTDYEEAIKIFETIPGWKDANECIRVCEKEIYKIKQEIEAERLEKERQVEIKRKEAERKAKKAKKVIAIGIPMVCILAIFTFLLIYTVIPYCRYNRAISLINDRDYIKAYETFIKLDGYKDSKDKAISVYELYKKEKIQNASVGDYVIFGSYEQDNDLENGKEDIEWLVLDIKDDKALLISKYGLDCKPYNNTKTRTTWETSDIRDWLNSEFVDSAFTTDEVDMIPTITVFANPNPVYDTDPGNETQDKVFLLSIDEANKYFNSDTERGCKPSEYALVNGAIVNEKNGNCYWWLRSPGLYHLYIANVGTDGSVDLYGRNYRADNSAVRPALWVNLNS